MPPILGRPTCGVVVTTKILEFRRVDLNARLFVAKHGLAALDGAAAAITKCFSYLGIRSGIMCPNRTRKPNCSSSASHFAARLDISAPSMPYVERRAAEATGAAPHPVVRRPI